MADVGSMAQLVWARPGHIWGLGLHLGVQLGLNNREITDRGRPATTLEARTVAVDLGFTYRVWGLWLSAGINFTHMGHVGGYKREYEDQNSPAYFLAMGYDFIIWRGLGIRVIASGSTTFVTMFRGMIGGGPVFRF
jgi:hypothetical protein